MCTRDDMRAHTIFSILKEQLSKVSLAFVKFPSPIFKKVIKILIPAKLEKCQDIFKAFDNLLLDLLIPKVHFSGLGI